MAAPIAFIVLSHTQPALVARLARRLLAGDPEAHVIVEHDPGGPPLELRDGDRLHVRVSTAPRAWGGFGLVAGVLEALRFAHDRLDPEWIVLVSGQDYPAAPAREIRRRLEASGQDALMQVRHDVDPDAREGAAAWWRARYFMRWYRWPLGGTRLGPRREGLQRRLSMAQPFVFVWTLPRGAGTYVGFRRRRTPFGPDFVCRAGSQWFALGRAARVSVLEQLRRRPELIAYYERTIIPDESFFTTLVTNDPALRVGEQDLTFTSMGGAGEAHARVLEAGDLDAILASGRPLVRKVDPELSAGLMDALDARNA